MQQFTTWSFALNIVLNKVVGYLNIYFNLYKLQVMLFRCIKFFCLTFFIVTEISYLNITYIVRYPVYDTMLIFYLQLVKDMK